TGRALLSPTEAVPASNPSWPLYPPRSSQGIKAFQTTLARSLNLNIELTSNKDIDDAINLFNHKICEALNKHTMPITATHKYEGHYPQSKIKLDPRTKILLAQYEFCKRQLRKNKTINNKRKASRLKNKLTKAIKRARESCIGGQLARLDPGDRYIMTKIWKITKKLKRQPPSNFPLKSTTSSGSDRTTDIKWTKTPQERAEVFAAHLEDRFTNNFDDNDLDQDKEIIIDELKNLLKNSPESPDVHFFFRLEDLKAIVAGLATAKSPGEDRITNKLIKILPLKALLFLLNIYNCILRLGYFPSA
ncbi:hypothetical protein KR026_001204, partial [Drosophila bipectinata]